MGCVTHLTKLNKPTYYMVLTYEREATSIKD